MKKVCDRELSASRLKIWFHTQLSFPFIEVSSIDKWNKKRLYDQIHFLRPAASSLVQLSNFSRQCVCWPGKVVPLDWCWQTDRRLIGDFLYFEKFCNKLPVFVFKSERYDVNFIKSYRLPLLVHERDLEGIVIKESNYCVSFTLANVKRLDNLCFLGGATKLDYFMKT